MRTPDLLNHNNPIPKLNFHHGQASKVLQAIVGHEAIVSARAENDKKREEGLSERNLMKMMPRFTAGHSVKVANSFEAGVSILDELKRREEIAVAQQKEKEQKALQTHRELHQKYLHLLRTKDRSKWTGQDYNTALRAKKKDTDGSIPTKVDAKKRLWDEIVARGDVPILEADLPVGRLFAADDDTCLETMNEQMENENKVDQEGVEALLALGATVAI